MTVVFPEGTKIQGNKSILVLQSVATPASVDLSSEIGDAATVNATFYLYGNFSPTADPNRGEAPARLGDKVAREQFGRVKYAIGDLSYVYDPQAADSTTENKVKAACPEGADVYLLERIGPDAETDIYAVGQRYNLHHVLLGPQTKVDTGSDEFSEAALSQPVSYVEPPVAGIIVA